MPAYLIVDTKIADHEAYERYKAAAKPIAEKHGGVYRARGGALTVLENGLWTPTRMVIIEFPSVADAQAFADDPEYAPVKAVRHGAAQCTLAILEGV